MKKLTALLSCMLIGSIATTALADDYYIIGQMVNETSWILGAADAKFSPTSKAGVYEWKGTKLASGFKINNGTWDDYEYNIGGTGDDGISLDRPFTYTVGRDAMDLYFEDVTEVINPVVTLNTNNGTITVTGDGVDAGETEYYIIGDNVNGLTWELKNEDCKFSQVAPGVYEWSGTELGSTFKINDGTWGRINIGAPDGSMLFLYESFTYQNQGSNIIIADADVVKNPHVTLNLSLGTIIVTGDGEFVTPVEEQEIYIVGTDVDGKVWQMADEESRLTYLGEGLYEWRGTTLGTGFKLSGPTFNDLDLGAAGNDDTLTPGVAFTLTEGASSKNISFADGIQTLTNPVVKLDWNSMTLTITGDAEGTAEWYLVGTFNDFGFTSQFITDENGQTVCREIPIRGIGEMYVTATGYSKYYGSYEAISDENMSVELTEDVTHILYNLDGDYTATWDRENMTLTFTRTGDYSGKPVDPITPSGTYMKLTTVNGPTVVMGVKEGESSSIGFNLDEYWEVSSITFNGEALTLDEDATFYTVGEFIEGENTVEAEISFKGELEIVSSDSGVVEIAGTELKISVSYGRIIVSGTAEGDEITLYSAAGLKLGQYVSDSDQAIIYVAPGIYVVRVGDVAAKVIL